MFTRKTRSLTKTDLALALSTLVGLIACSNGSNSSNTPSVKNDSAKCSASSGGGSASDSGPDSTSKSTASDKKSSSTKTTSSSKTAAKGDASSSDSDTSDSSTSASSGTKGKSSSSTKSSASTSSSTDDSTALRLTGSTDQGCSGGGGDGGGGSGGGDGGGDDGNGGGGKSGGSGKTTAPSATTLADFTNWCKLAGQTNVATQTMPKIFANFCANGKAKDLITTTLVNNAFSGNGTPTIQWITKPTSDVNAKQTTAVLAVGIKLPISIQSHFDSIGPLAGDKDALTKATVTGGASQDNLTIAENTDTDKYKVRGWDIDSATSQSVSGISLASEIKTTDTQYMLKKGSLYLYTTVTTDGVKLIKDQTVMTAGIQINKTGYLLTVASLTIDNKGSTIIASIAESQIKKKAASLVQQMYDVAKIGAKASSASSSDAAGGDTAASSDKASANN